MKLQSTTDFVLAESKHGVFKYTNTQIRDYANFLKQQLNKGMFVPCDLEGNVLEEPERLNYSYNPLINQMHDDKVSKYQQAKERVLFEGCETMQQGENTIIMFNQTAIWLTWTSRVIEDMIPNHLILTESAIKQFM